MILAQHRRQLVRISDPDRGCELRCVPDEPGVAVVFGRPGLPRRGPIGKCRPFTGAGSDDAFEDARKQRVLVARQNGTSDRPVVVDDLSLRIRNARDRPRPVSECRPVHTATLVRERRERARHLERAHRVGAETDREVRIEVACDAHQVCGPRDVCRPDEASQLREDAVVRNDRRRGQVG